MLTGMRPPREDAETLGNMFAFDCGLLSKETNNSTFSRRGFADALHLIREKHFDSLLLYKLDGYSPNALEGLTRMALSAGFERVRIELPLESIPDTGFVANLLSLGVDEAHITLPSMDSLSKRSGNKREMGKVAADVKAIITAAGEISRGHSIRVKTALPRTVTSCEKIVRLLVGARAEYIVLEAESTKATAVNAKNLRMLCGILSRNLDIAIELRHGDSSITFRGPTHRLREAEALLLDVPYCTIGEKCLPLGAVFQLGFNCNQRCLFCSSDRTLPRAGDKKIFELLKEILTRNIPRVVFTGGEPTINRSLCDYVAMCKEAGVSEVSLYTNGMALGEASYTRRLAGAGLDLGLISLHSGSAAISDTITRCPGGYRRTVKGIENLLGTGSLVIINYVLNSLNYKETPGFATFASQRFPGAAVNFSYVAPVMEHTASNDIVPRFSDAVPYLLEALDNCEEIGLTAAGLEPHWGVPPCVLKGDRRYYPLLFSLTERFSGFVKAKTCLDCRLADCCPGIRKGYALLHGMNELSAI